jgi:Domain of unknown function (DUF3536)/Glycosyl hydrolase family 57
MSGSGGKPRLWVCVHGHFYQPPRDNPWLDEIEPQPSAAPYRDWNERITAECYRPNAAARVLDGKGLISEILDNYQRMSWNFGPTLLDYLFRHARDVHDAIVAADHASRARFSGHGSAMAQAHSHLILPLCSPRDRKTQIRWGAADFEHRFGRKPEGMWLPECAVDTATLEALVDEGLGFTVLAPRQAAGFRPPGGGASGAWQRGAIDTRRGYRCPLPSGRSIDLYFYDGALAQAVAFEHLLRDGRELARRLVALPPLGGDEASLSHIATDGESYGHHHRFGDMALAAALHAIEGDPRFRLTNYAELRALHPPAWEVQIAEPSSWSCAHGVRRWCDDCGCNTGAQGVHQRWRKPLRDALDWLRDRAHAVIEAHARGIFEDPWRARDAYIAVILNDGSADAREAFFAAELAAEAGGGDKAARDEARKKALWLMELGRSAMLMFTSCGWFFDDISGIETLQVMRYAARALEMLQLLTGEDLEGELVKRLAAAEGNHRAQPALKDGAAIWKAQVATHRLDLARIARHVAVGTVVAEESEAVPFGVAAELLARRELRAEELQLVSGTIRLRSRWLYDAMETSFACLRRGSQVVGRLGSTDTLNGLVRELGKWMDRPDAAISMMTSHAGTELSLGCLLPIATRWVEDVFAAPIADLEQTIFELHERNLALSQWLVRHEAPAPDVLSAVTRLALRRRLIGAIEATPLDAATAETCLSQARQLGVSLDTPAIALAATLAMTRTVEGACKIIEGTGERKGDDVETTEAAAAALDGAARIGETIRPMKSPLDLWRVQNLTVQLGRASVSSSPGMLGEASVAAALARLASAVGVALPSRNGGRR